MRKALALLVALVLLGSGGMIAAHAAVNSARDQVVIEENVVYGDKLAAAGLNIERNVHWDNHLHWSTEYDIAEENSCHTEFDFTQSETGNRYSSRYESSGVDISVYVNGGMGSSHGITEDIISEMFNGYEELCLDVMERTKAGEEHVEIIEIADYYDYYPLQIDIDISECLYVRGEGAEREWLEPLQSGRGDEIEEVCAALREYFRIPTEAGARVEVRVHKTDSGAATGLDLNTLIDREYSYTCSVVAENGAYFTFDSGSQFDFSEVPGGYGIYCLPIVMSSKLSDTEYRTVDEKGLSMVYPLDESTEIKAFFTDVDGKHLLMVTYEDGKYMFTSIDLMTMTEKQRFEIAEAAEENDRYVWVNKDAEDFIVIEIGGEQLCVLSRLGEGEYSRELLADRQLETENEMFEYRTDCIYAYDGERLAVGWDEQVETHPYTGCGFCIAVYDSEGLQYFGKYGSSLTSPAGGSQYNYYCQPRAMDRLLLEWK